jgi:hypothetical protein
MPLRGIDPQALSSAQPAGRNQLFLPASSLPFASFAIFVVPLPSFSGGNHKERKGRKGRGAERESARTRRLQNLVAQPRFARVK